MKSYKEILSELYSVNKVRGVKFSLENMLRLDACLSKPSRAFLSVHVAGTNGKGSVVAKVAKGLESKFFRVGKFTSPHISTFRERITINGEMITEEEVARLLPKIMKITCEENIPATFFELTTLLAFQYFAEKKVDFAVIETGLGGRLDATNILTPALSVITSIDLDHTDLLGHTLDSIAFEKGGIIKPYVPVILGPSASIVPLKKGCQAIQVSETFNSVEEENRAIAKEALKFLKVSPHAIKKALTTRLPCRREVLSFQGKDIILDVAHNPAGFKRLFQELGIPKDQLRAVFAISKTKDLSESLRMIQESVGSIHLTASANGRSADPYLLKKQLLLKNFPEENISVDKSVVHSLSSALSKSAQTHQKILVFGTFFIMGEARQFLGIEESKDPIDLNEFFLSP